MKYKTVIFDLDDTLCNTSEVLEKALYEVYENYLTHFPTATTEEIKKLGRRQYNALRDNPDIPITSVQILALHGIFETLSKKPDPVLINKLQNDIRTAITNKIKLLPGAQELLDVLKKQCITIGLLTNGTFRDQADKLEALGIVQSIDYMVTPDMCISEKPHKRAFMYTLDKLHASIDSTIMVGDDYKADIKGAQSIGMDTIFMDVVDWGHTIDTKPTHTSTSLKDARKWLTNPST